MLPSHHNDRGVAWCGVGFEMQGPLAHLTGLRFGYRPPYPVEPNVLATFMALTPAFIRAYLGALAGFGLRQLKQGAA